MLTYSVSESDQAFEKVYSFPLGRSGQCGYSVLCDLQVLLAMKQFKRLCEEFRSSACETIISAKPPSKDFTTIIINAHISTFDFYIELTFNLHI